MLDPNKLESPALSRMSFITLSYDSGSEAASSCSSWACWVAKPVSPRSSANVQHAAGRGQMPLQRMRGDGKLDGPGRPCQPLPFIFVKGRIVGSDQILRHVTSFTSITAILPSRLPGKPLACHDLSGLPNPFEQGLPIFSVVL